MLACMRPRGPLTAFVLQAPEKLRGALRNHGGGYVNHKHFFTAWMAPPGAVKGWGLLLLPAAAPHSLLHTPVPACRPGGCRPYPSRWCACRRDQLDIRVPRQVQGGAGIFSRLFLPHFLCPSLISTPTLSPQEFSNAAATVFGSGWAWLIVDKSSGVPVLKVVATPNQDTPAMTGAHPILGLDVWCVLRGCAALLSVSLHHLTHAQSLFFSAGSTRTTSSSRTSVPRTLRRGGTSSTGLLLRPCGPLQRREFRIRYSCTGSKFILFLGLFLKHVAVGGKYASPSRAGARSNWGALSEGSSCCGDSSSRAR